MNVDGKRACNDTVEDSDASETNTIHSICAVSTTNNTLKNNMPTLVLMGLFNYNAGSQQKEQESLTCTTELNERVKGKSRSEDMDFTQQAFADDGGQSCPKLH